MIRTATNKRTPDPGRSELDERERAQVEKYLLPNEELVATVRRHPAVLISSASQAIVGLLVAFALTATLLRGRGVLIWIVWGLWGLVMFRLIWEFVNWAVDYFIITSKRILLTSGVFTRNVAMMPLTKVTDMSFRRTFAGRMLGYGEFVVESAGQDAALRTIDHIPYPEELYQRVCERIFPDAAVVKKPKEPEKQAGPGAQPDVTNEAGSAEIIESGSGEMLDLGPDDTQVLDTPVEPDEL